MHPVGSYYITNDSTDPSTIFGIGTWVRVKGRVLVGVDEDDAALLSPNKTGGSVNPLTSHTHDFSRSGATAILTGGTPSTANQIAVVQSGGYWGSTASGSLQSSGSNTNHANWQPFQTAYMWYRSA
ncbi:phage baseplate protein [Lactococcus taiwanensis]|uniref:phage baseplate protein n=1 Tax=Lactococcus taiwanensis TaxID=1151742 RepID=UPI003D146C3D